MSRVLITSRGVVIAPVTMPVQAVKLSLMSTEIDRDLLAEHTFILKILWVNLLSLLAIDIDHVIGASSHKLDVYSLSSFRRSMGAERMLLGLTLGQRQRAKPRLFSYPNNIPSWHLTFVRYLSTKRQMKGMDSSSFVIWKEICTAVEKGIRNQMQAHMERLFSYPNNITSWHLKFVKYLSTKRQKKGMYSSPFLIWKEFCAPVEEGIRNQMQALKHKGEKT